MNHTVMAYWVYIPVALGTTIWVARALHRNGRVFLVQACRGDAELADSVNQLLVVGFYLMNIGFVALALSYGAKPANVQETFEFLATKLGVAWLVLGFMHFFNLWIFERMRKHGQRQEALPRATPPPLRP